MEFIFAPLTVCPIPTYIISLEFCNVSTLPELTASTGKDEVIPTCAYVVYVPATPVLFVKFPVQDSS